MRKIITFFFILFTIGLCAQTKSDSIKVLIDQSSNWNEKAELTYEFCKLNLGSNPNECLTLYTFIEENEKKVTDDAQLFNLYNVKGVIYQYRHNTDSSNMYLKKAFNLALEIKDSLLLIKSIGNLSINYRNEGDYKKAVEFLLIALDYHKSHKDTISWANSLTEIGNAYIYLKNYDEGMNYQRKALNFFLAKNYWRGIGNTYSSISYSFKEQNNLDSSIYYLELAIEGHENSGNIFSIASAKRALCGYYSNKESGKSKQEIYECHKDVLVYDLQIGDKQGVMMDYLNMSMSLNNMNKFREALRLNFKALELSKELGDLRIRLKCYKSIAVKSYNLDEFEEGYKYLDSAMALEIELTNIDVQNAVLEADKKYQVAEKEKELLQTKKQKAEVELDVAKKSKQIWLLIGGTIILFLVGGFIFYRAKQKQQSTLAKIRIEEQQKGLAAVIQVQEEERKRIAKDLHDGIVQQLGGLKLGLQKIFTGEETEETNKIVKILDDSAQELRELSHQMMPRSLSELGLIPAIEDMLDNSLGNTAIKYQFEHFGIKERFKENIEIAIYRIAQELINNVIKHSKANKVNVQLFKTGKDVLLIVEDNGEGINASGQKEGIGLMNISSRLDTINGKVNFEPSHESGTLATVKIPIVS